MFLSRSSYLLLLAGVVLSCTKNVESTKKPFYNLDSLIESQVAYLAEKKPVLFKEATMDNKTDTVYLKDLDTTAWLKELEIFRQLDLNSKPVNLENYSVKLGIPDPYSNLHICEYKAKEKLPIRWVKIYYYDNLSNPKKIEGEYYEFNGLYSNARKMTMELNNVYNKTLLTYYSITGGQRMILGDTVEFKITGKLKH